MMRKYRGFTLIELLVVVAIITLLSGIVLFNVMKSLADAKQKATQAQIDALSLALEQYKSDLRSYPPQRYLIEALEKKGIGASLNWHGPYYTFKIDKVGTTDASGNLTDAKNGQLAYFGGGSAGNLLPPSSTVFLDEFGRPFVYFPYYQYTSGKAIEDFGNETGFYNPTTFQIFSFGQDGKSTADRSGNDALLLWTDGKDNDGDGLVDKADNLKTTKEVPPKPEDDLANF